MVTTMSFIARCLRLCSHYGKQYLKNHVNLAPTTNVKQQITIRLSD